ncbi:hypothetical protein T484DRAFT_1806328, partial [Baffinella frigidus]
MAFTNACGGQLRPRGDTDSEGAFRPGGDTVGEGPFRPTGDTDIEGPFRPTGETLRTDGSGDVSLPCMATPAEKGERADERPRKRAPAENRPDEEGSIVGDLE